MLDGDEEDLQVSENLALNLTATAERHGARTAVRLDAAALSFTALDQVSARMASVLRERGVEPGDRVGVMLPNVPEFAVAYYGILRAGGIVVPMNVLLKRREVAYYLQDSGAKLVLAWHDFEHQAAPGAAQAGADCVVVSRDELARLLDGVEARGDVAERDGGDTAVILYTSGTTGQPKGAELTHSNLCRNAGVAARLFHLSPDSVVLGALPLFHSFGQTCALNAAITSGACLTLIARFDAGKVLEVIERDRVTVFEGVPTMYAALLGHPARDRLDTSSLHVGISGGAAIPVEVLRGFEEAFGCVILEGYGLSETSPAACFNHRHRQRKPGSVGTPIEGVEMKVVDEAGQDVPVGQVGEVAIRGHNVMKGYWRRPDATAEAISADGWFRTGDLARVDEDGYFFIVDRKKELIIRGGYNVYPREIEEVLYEHPAVRECAVIGIPHPELGEEVGAAVVLKPEVEATEPELREFVKRQVAAYKYPRHVWLLDQLPKTATGKIFKREIELPAGLAGASGPQAG
jgi:long-chain acyl-CoA synthetase